MTDRLTKTKGIIEQRLKDNNYTILEEREIQYGHQYVLLGGAIINIYTSGKMLFQGKEDADLKLLLR